MALGTARVPVARWLQAVWLVKSRHNPRGCPRAKAEGRKPIPNSESRTATSCTVTFGYYLYMTNQRLRDKPVPRADKPVP